MDSDLNPMSTVLQHREEIAQNLRAVRAKPVLRRVYRGFHELIAGHLVKDAGGATVELGSGIAGISEVIPGCVRTDLFPNPWVDKIENGYALSFPSGSVANLILFAVFHHLRYPGTALREFHRVLTRGGRVVLFEPCVSLLGRLVYGALHPEPLGYRQPISWFAPPGWSASEADYYAAQANASRIFSTGSFSERLADWNVLARQKLSAISYVASGGYSGPQLYPDRAYPWMRHLDRACDRAPWLFATRLLIVLEKK